MSLFSAVFSIILPVLPTLPPSGLASVSMPHSSGAPADGALRYPGIEALFRRFEAGG